MNAGASVDGRHRVESMCSFGFILARSSASLSVAFSVCVCGMDGGDRGAGLNRDANKYKRLRGYGTPNRSASVWQNPIQ